MKKILNYILVALAAAGVTAWLFTVGPLSPNEDYTKLEEMRDLIGERFIGEVDPTAMEDAAAMAMVAALDDEWSYYISAADYDSYKEQMSNAYVGVGITISVREDGYLDIVQVEEGGPAAAAGIQVGDILIRANGQDCAELGLNETGKVVKGEEGTTVELTLRRGDREIVLDVERKYFEVTVAEGQMLDGQIGLVSIYNFDERCADETLAAVDGLMAQGARALIFDVRNNPGGYQHELVEVLDYLLPEGLLFRSEFYDGTVQDDRSDPECLDIPMAVLVNGESYSAAEFFAAALNDYDAAVVVGTQTYGKGYFQQTFPLSDGSAMGLSVGKYYTPKGENLAGVGLTPDVEVEVDEETFLEVYYGNLDPMEDPQILAAIDALKSGN